MTVHVIETSVRLGALHSHTEVELEQAVRDAVAKLAEQVLVETGVSRAVGTNFISFRGSGWAATLEEFDAIEWRLRLELQ